MTDWIERARAMGFDTAGPLNPKQLVAREDVRGMCAADKCRAYNKNWTCPPACGSVEACQEKMHSYDKGIQIFMQTAPFGAACFLL